MKLRKMYRNILICIIIIFSIIASVTIANASNFNTLRNRVEQAITKIEQVKSSNSILNKILNEMSDEIEEDGSDPEKNGETEDKSGETSGNIDGEQEENTETQNDNKYNVQMELNIITEEGEAVTEGNKLKITDITDTYEENNSQEETGAVEDEGIGEDVGTGENEETGDNDNPEKSEENTKKSELEIKILNLISGEPIKKDEDGSFHTSGQGVIVDFSNMEKNKKYQVLIENLEVTEDYIKTIENMTLELQVDEEENIIAKIINIENSEEQDIGVEGQFWANLHDANGNGEVKISQQSKDPDMQIQYRIGQTGEWQNYSVEANISDNGTIYAKASKNGKESSETEKIVKNIDSEEPQLIEYNEDNEDKDNESIIKVKLKDNASGIVKYGISTSNEIEPDTYIYPDTSLTKEDIDAHRNETPQLEVDGTIDGIHENGEYYIWIWDTAENCKIAPINVENVVEKYVAEIVEVSDGYEGLLHKQYTSLRKAIAACPDTEGSSATIKIIAEITNENNDIGSKNITINLNGFTVNNNSETKPTITVNGTSTLTILNTFEDGTTSINGSISSQYSTAILVEEGGTLTLRS